VFSFFSGCLFSPDKGDPEPTLYYEPADSAWKVVANLQMAYENRDHAQYMACFRSDFEFHLLETDWDDYNGDGIIDTYWGIDQEDAFHNNMFNSVEDIELSFSGNVEYPFMGDTTGVSWVLTRVFDLKVYTSVGAPADPRATGLREMLTSSADPMRMASGTSGQWYDRSEI
jgi:hypothetical protein